MKGGENMADGQVKVAIHLADNGVIEGATLIYWEDPKFIQDCLGDGDVIVDVEKSLLKGEFSQINNLAEMLHRLENADDLSCGTSAILSETIPNLIIEALNKRGCIRKIARRRSHVK